jgi:hypothetical protein
MEQDVERARVDLLEYRANLALARASGVNSNLAAVNDQSPHIPTSGAKTAVIAARLVGSRDNAGDSRFMVSLHGNAAAAAAADSLTWTVDVYTDAVAGTPLTLPANAEAVGLHSFIDNSGAGIAPSAGATLPVTQAQDTKVIAGTGDDFQWTGVVVAPVGQTMYVTLSITDSVAARAVTSATVAAVEL